MFSDVVAISAGIRYRQAGRKNLEETEHKANHCSGDDRLTAFRP